MKCSLIHTVPNCSRRAARIAFQIEPVNTDDDRPNLTSFAHRPPLLVREPLNGHDRTEHLVLDDLEDWSGLAMIVGSK